MLCPRLVVLLSDPICHQYMPLLLCPWNAGFFNVLCSPGTSLLPECCPQCSPYLDTTSSWNPMLTSPQCYTGLYSNVTWGILRVVLQCHFHWLYFLSYHIISHGICISGSTNICFMRFSTLCLLFSILLPNPGIISCESSETLTE